MNSLSYNNYYNKILANYLIFLLIIYVLFFTQVSPSFFLLVSGSVATCLFGWIMFIEYKNNEIRITPILVISIIPFFMLGIASIYKSFIYSNQNYEILAATQVSTYSIVMAYLMVATGLFFQFLGMILLKPKTVAIISNNLVRKDIQLVKYFILFVIISEITDKLFELGILQNFLYQIPLSILIFISIKDKDNLLTTYVYKRNFILFGSGLIFLLNLTSLSKTTLVYSMIPVLLFYIIQSFTNRRKRILILIVISSVSALYFLFVQPLVSNARLFSKIYKVDITPGSLANFILSGDYNITLSNVDIDKNPIEIFLSRMFELNAPAYIYEQTNKEGYLTGSTFENIAYGLIPRLVWPSKPSIPQGQKFSYQISGMTDVYVGMLISGELYWNFGFIGIIIGSLIIGLLTGYLWHQLNKLIVMNFIYFTLYIYLLQSSQSGSEFSSVFIGLLQLIVIYFVIKSVKNLKKENLN